MTIRTRARDSLVIFCLVSSLAFHNCTNERAASDVASDQSNVSPELMAIVDFRPMITHDTLVGFIEPARDVEVSSQLEGLLSQVIRDLGDPVDSGEVMAVMENTQYRLDVERTRIKHARARSELERLRVLTERSLTSTAELEEAELAEQEAVIELKQTEYNLELTSIQAPFQGVVVARWARSGQWVEAGTPLFRVVEPGRPHARLFWDANQCTGWKIGDTLWCLRPNDSVYPGVISRASPVPDPVSGTREFIVEFDRKCRLSSTTVRLIYIQRESNTRLTVPREVFAPRFPLRSRVVGTVTRLSSGRPETVPVTVGAVGTHWVEITGGLEQGDTIRLTTPITDAIP